MRPPQVLLQLWLTKELGKVWKWTGSHCGSTTMRARVGSRASRTASWVQSLLYCQILGHIESEGNREMRTSGVFRRCQGNPTMNEVQSALHVDLRKFLGLVDIPSVPHAGNMAGALVGAGRGRDAGASCAADGERAGESSVDRISTLPQQRIVERQTKTVGFPGPRVARQTCRSSWISCDGVQQRSVEHVTSTSHVWSWL